MAGSGQGMGDMGVGWILLGESPESACFSSLIGQIYGVANQTASVFLTQITGRFGYSTVKTNLLTVGPYSCATAVLCKLNSVFLTFALTTRGICLLF